MVTLAVGFIAIGIVLFIYGTVAACIEYERGNDDKVESRLIVGVAALFAVFNAIRLLIG